MTNTNNLDQKALEEAAKVFLFAKLSDDLKDNLEYTSRIIQTYLSAANTVADNGWQPIDELKANCWAWVFVEIGKYTEIRMVELVTVFQDGAPSIPAYKHACGFKYFAPVIKPQPPLSGELTATEQE